MFAHVATDTELVGQRSDDFRQDVEFASATGGDAPKLVKSGFRFLGPIVAVHVAFIIFLPQRSLGEQSSPPTTASDANRIERNSTAQQQDLLKLERLVFLSHPYAWEIQFAANPTRAESYRLGEFDATNLIRMERQISSRWPEEIRKLGSRDFLIVNYFGARPSEEQFEAEPMAPLLQAAKEHLGDRYLFLFGTRASNRQGKEIRKQLLDKGFTYDPATVETESWGQSTEGCVANFSAHFSDGMGLPHGFPMRYELTFPDATFAMTGRHLERLSLKNSDVHCYLSETTEGKPFAIFFPGVLRDGESDRYVDLKIEPKHVRFSDKVGSALDIPQENGRFRIPLHVDGYGKPVYIWGENVTLSEFRTMLAGATPSTKKGSRD